MKITKNKIVDFFKGRGFYLVLAFCLVATGVAAWTAWAGMNTPDTPMGIASETIAHFKNVGVNQLFWGKSAKIPINTKGIAIIRITLIV